MEFSSGLRTKRRKRRVWLAVGGVAAAVVLVAGCAALSHAPFMRVSGVVVGEEGGVPGSAVEEFVRKTIEGRYFFIFPKDNVFLYPKYALESGLRKEFPILKDAQVRARDFKTLEVSLTVREPAALWCTSNEGTCKLMDEEGVVYADAPHFSSPVYVSYEGPLTGEGVPAQYLSPEGFRALFALVDALTKKVEESDIERVSTGSPVMHDQHRSREV